MYVCRHIYIYIYICICIRKHRYRHDILQITHASTVLGHVDGAGGHLHAPRGADGQLGALIHIKV